MMKSVYTPDNKKMIFFDMNHTLVNERGTLEHCYIDVLHGFTARWDADEQEAALKKSFETYEEEWRKRPQSGESFSQRRIRCLSKALSPFPLAVNDSFAQHFFDKVNELKIWRQQLFPDTLETLEKLAKSYDLSIISNGSRQKLESQIEQLNLARLFPKNRQFSSQSKKYRKPDPAIFRHALQQTGVSARHAVMVGNSWKNDVHGANRCGMDAIWFRPSSRVKWSVQKLGRNSIIVIGKMRQLLDIFKVNET